MASTSTPPSYLQALNTEQRHAVEALDGPVLVLAGAGTGKTRVLTSRIAHTLISGKAMPGEILAVTFTNKAAREMIRRIEDLTGIPADTSPGPGSNRGMWIGTFHSICAKILRRHAETLGFTAQFTILDADDQIRLLKTLMEERQLDTQAHPPKLVMAIIQGWKDQGLTPEKLGASASHSATGNMAMAMYAPYQQRLKILNAMDFGDLMLHCLSLFTAHTEILERYARRFRYVLVDEYQDTNIAQYLWLRLLAMGHRNICCVGDDDQSIYGWRGAEVGNILKFEQDFPGATVIRLERNYRSTQHILGAASGLISHNQSRLGKTLWTEANGGDKVRIKSVWDDQEEARFIGEEVEQKQREGFSLNDMAILVRAGFQTRAFEERFMTLGVAYRVVGGLRFYERMEIRDVIAYLRITHQPDDDLALERIINTPRRGIGKTTLTQLHTLAREQNISLHQAITTAIAKGTIKGKTATTLEQLLQNFARWREMIAHIPFAQVADTILDESGYRAMWQQDKSPEAAGRLENIKELLQAMSEYPTLTEFLEHVGLVTDHETANPDGEMVSMMTLHAAKGLEFQVVFLPGWEEGLFPHQRAMDESGKKGLEEERRLAYVGITRARQHLMISHAANRRIYNQWQSSLASRFLEELPKEHVEFLGGGTYGNMPPQGREGWRREISALMASAQQRSQPAAATKPVAEQPFPKGSRVFHQKFGYGKVESVQGNHLDIAFEKAGRKRVLADYVQKHS